MKKKQESDAGFKDKILSLLQGSYPNGMRTNEISVALQVRSDSADHNHVRSALQQLEKENLILRSARRRYCWKPGGTKSGFRGTLHIVQNRGRVDTNNADFPAIFIKPQNLGTALDGDIVQVKLLALKKDKKPYGLVSDVVERGNQPIAGKIEFDGDFYFLVPDEPRYLVDFLIPKKLLLGAKHGDKVVGKFYRWTDPHKSPEVAIVEVIGHAGDIAVEFAGILREFRISSTFPDSIKQEAKEVASIPKISALRSRRDLTNMPVITIDPDDAKDFDDALSLVRLENGNVELGVHIADVSHYLKEGSDLDKEAAKRGNSVYLTDRVAPMLPEELSTDICSLVPGKLRLTYSVFMEFSQRGALKSYNIQESFICSSRRFTYMEAQNIIESKQGDYSELIVGLHSLACMLRKKRFVAGSIDFETTETKFILDETLHPVSAVVKGRTDATSLVEECMLAANKTVALHIKSLSREHQKKGLLPFLYRVHDRPDNLKLRDVIRYVNVLGISAKTEGISSRDINNILKKAENLPEKPVIHQFMLRSMAKAVYSDVNIGHFGLAFSDYTHFTSPIRRYPDVMVHRLLKEYNSTDSISQSRFFALKKWIEEVCSHCTLTERVAIDAERASIKVAQADFALRHLGEEFIGTVSGVVNFGLFVIVDRLYIEGLLHIKDVHDDYYYFDEKHFRLVGRRTKNMFRVGEKIIVKISAVSKEKRTVDFQYIGKPNSGESTMNDNSAIDGAEVVA